MNYQKKIVLGISGGSAIELALSFIKYCPDNIFLYIVVSKGARVVFNSENRCNDHKIDLVKIIKSLNKNIEICNGIDNKLSSGSFKFDDMIILPTSANTLALIANGIGNNLLTRAAMVCLKERRRLVLALREMPFSNIMIANMNALSSDLVIIAPPIIAYYASNDLESMERFLVGKYYDLLEINHNMFKRWGS